MLDGQRVEVESSTIRVLGEVVNMPLDCRLRLLAGGNIPAQDALAVLGAAIGETDTGLK